MSPRCFVRLLWELAQRRTAYEPSFGTFLDCVRDDLSYRHRRRGGLEGAKDRREARLMDQTDIWMLGVGAFGVVFYLLSLYYGRKGRGR